MITPIQFDVLVSLITVLVCMICVRYYTMCRSEHKQRIAAQAKVIAATAILIPINASELYK